MTDLVRTNKTVITILQDLIKGKISIDKAENLLNQNQILHLKDIAKIDIGRDIRKGIPEVVLGEGKEESDLIAIIEKTLKRQGRVIVSRINPLKLAIIKKRLDPKKIIIKSKKTVAVFREKSYRINTTGGKIGVLTAGTSDIQVAEEAQIIAEEMGCRVFLEVDVGVAGIHRLIPALKKMVESKVEAIVVVAGMEGALPSVVTGVVSVPVIGVPASSGYGFGKEGLAALMAMLQSCTLGLSVVNIDNGISGGSFAALIANNLHRKTEINKNR